MTIRVLIADDHRVMREGLGLVLSRHPDLAVVGEAADGQEVLRKVERLRPDVVLLDILMPVLDGVATALQLRAEYPDVRIVVLTMDTNPDNMRRLIEADIAGLVMKAGPTSEVVRAIRAAARGEVVLDQAIARRLLADFRRTRDDDGGTRAFGLTEREREILARLVDGESNKEIARGLNLSEHTVRNHLYSIFGKMGVSDRTQAAVLALRSGLVSGSPPAATSVREKLLP
jgi:DNA-binding NarL/FixJ family response regulator